MSVHGISTRDEENNGSNNNNLNDFPAETDTPLTAIPEENNAATDPPLQQEENPTVPRRSNRTTRPPSYLRDYECHSVIQDKTSTPHSLNKYLSYEHLSPAYKTFILALTAHFEPTNYIQASQHRVWNQAMQRELFALLKNKTWTYVRLPRNKRAIGCRWVYKIKYNSDRSVERCKARLVAQGYTQQEGLDFFDTFSPVAKMVTFKLLLAIATIKQWHTLQLDVDNTFLNGDLNEEVYMELPKGLNLPESMDQNSNLVCKLNKSIYGLKQSSRKWYRKLSDALIQEGFTQYKADYTLFTKGHNESFIALLVYVDDIILARPNLQLLHQLQTNLHSRFSLKTLGNLKYFLEFEIARAAEGLFLSQRKYTLTLLEDHGFSGSKPAKTPMDPKIKLDDQQGTPIENPSQYRQLAVLDKACSIRHNHLCISEGFPILIGLLVKPHVAPQPVFVYSLEIA
uniref:Reverse transcriptase Ty1/copia-type domain-containing protein n=1 Tax=Cannabis sativa TaxID=3483 RepID=A0A803QIC3_CANSA